MKRRPDFTLRLNRARNLIVGVATVSGLSVASSAVGFVFQVLLAARFGAGAAIDGYLFAISAPTFLAALGAAALSYLVVPALVNLENEHSTRAAVLRRLRRRVWFCALAFAFVGVPAAFIQPYFLPSAAALRQLEALPFMISAGWAIGGAQLLSGLYTVELNAARKPVTAALLALPPNLGAIAVVLLAPSSILAASLGVLLGSIAALLVGQELARRVFRTISTHIDPVQPLPTSNPGQLIWTLLAMSCFSAYAVIDAFWAPRAGAGTLASLGYAQRLIVGLGSLIVAGPSAIFTPRFASKLRDSGSRAFLREVGATLLGVALVAATTAAALAVTAPFLIDLVFTRGAFDASDTARVISVFRAMLPGFCAMLISVVATRAIFCLPKVEKFMAAAGLAWSIIYAAACGILLRLAEMGFGVSYSLAWAAYLAISLTILYWSAHRHAV